MLAYHAFFPNFAYRPGVLTNLAWSMAARATWVARQVGTSGGAGGIRELPHIEIKAPRVADRGALLATPVARAALQGGSGMG